MPELGFKLRQAGFHGIPLPSSVLFDSGKHGSVRAQKEVWEVISVTVYRADCGRGG